MIVLVSTLVWIIIFFVAGFSPLFASAISMFIIWYAVETICIVAPPVELVLLVQSLLLSIVLFCSIFFSKKYILYVYVVIVALFTVVCVCSGFLCGYVSLHGKFGIDQFAGIFYTNMREARENFYIYIGTRGILYTLLFLLIVLLPFFIPARLWKKYGQILPRFRYLTPFLSVILLSMAVFVFVSGNGRPYAIVEMARSCLSQGKYIKSRPVLQRKSGVESRNMTILLVIGESATTAHMSAYGYYRQTTPWLEECVDRGEAILFQRAFSAHSYTAQTVPLMLSELHQYRAGDMRNAPTIINRMQAKGYDTWWISNQERRGLHVSTISTLAEEAEHCFFMGEKESDLGLDDALLSHVVQAVNSRNAPGRFIICHLMGSHTDYSKRYPDGFEPDLGGLSGSLWGDVGREKQAKINAYDKSIAFTDSFLRTLVSRLPKDEKIALVYVSDHGESPTWESFHDSSKELRHDIFSIPMVIWFSDVFRREEPETVSRLRSISREYITNDRVADILAFLESGCGSPESLVQRDPREALIRYGEASVAQLDRFQTAERIRRLSAMTGKNIFLEGANSLEKLRIGVRSGFDGVKISVGYDPSRKQLRVNWPETADALPLATFLETLRTWGREDVRLWLVMKGVEGSAADEVLACLEALDARFAIRERSLVDISLSGDMPHWRQQRWRVAHHLPAPPPHDVGGREMCRHLAEVRRLLDVRGVSLDLATYNLMDRACPADLQEISLYVRFPSPRDISTRNTITSALTREKVAGEDWLKAIAITLETDEDRCRD
ncbi:phosphoethanolamine transferase [uncultured Desulfovibrio sp.]|uniref:phosphoethanolamine transferase n=1 Tax=uncultured Desulfovibrio sp. TaxID=167968 RepID=UPI00260297BB|nr:phosphoethanolamine transferase [uncultured Desulfovibrio sp.]